MLKKIGEEATEVVLAALVQSDERLAEESADLLYHLLVALHQRGLPLTRVMDELRKRRSPSPRARSVETECEGSAGGSADPSSPDHGRCSSG